MSVKSLSVFIKFELFLSIQKKVLLVAFHNQVRAPFKKKPTCWWALIELMQCSGDTCGEERTRTADLLTASQALQPTELHPHHRINLLNFKRHLRKCCYKLIILLAFVWHSCGTNLTKHSFQLFPQQANATELEKLFLPLFS